MLHLTSLVLFESTDAPAVLNDPANADWLAVVHQVDGEVFDLIIRRFYAALYHFRSKPRRSPLPGRVELQANGRQAALRGMLELVDERKGDDKPSVGRSHRAVLVEAGIDPDDPSLHESLRDFSKRPPLLEHFLGGRGRPPCDALAMMRAFLAAPLLGVCDSPRAVFSLLRCNPTFARACGFLGRDACKRSWELTSRRLPGLSTCVEFQEVMTRYGLWQLARVELVHDNLARGVVPVEDTLALDTTHVLANSHCANVEPAPTTPPEQSSPRRTGPAGGRDDRTATSAQSKQTKPKHRKVPRMRKWCGCGRRHWEHCEHPWSPTDHGAAVVVKGGTRIYWAHKVSVASFVHSGIPLDVRTLQYAAEHDGKTLVAHLEVLQRAFPEVIAGLRAVLADDAYRGNGEAVARFGQHAHLYVPVHPSGRNVDGLAAVHRGIRRFTSTGVPVCQAGHRFEFRGRDVAGQRYIWSAPDDDDSDVSVCLGCPLAAGCSTKGNRRTIRVDRASFPQIHWERPQHSARHRAQYAKRTSVERAIKRLKVDLGAETLTHRDTPRVQAHMDRKLLTLHLLLRAQAG
jgi:hypothetical protein